MPSAWSKNFSNSNGQVEAQADLEHAAVDPAAVAALYARYDSELVEG
jgi:hypothetical protein